MRPPLSVFAVLFAMAPIVADAAPKPAHPIPAPHPVVAASPSAPKPAPPFTRDPAGACALKLARAVSLNTTQSASDLAYAITQRCLKDEPLSGPCALDAKSPCEVRDDAKFLLLQQLSLKLVLAIRLDDVIARSPK